MSEIPVILECPLGAKCEKVADGKIVRCAWQMEVHHPRPDASDLVEKGCALTSIPVLLSWVNANIRGLQAATESSRNETLKGFAGLAGALVQIAEVVVPPPMPMNSHAFIPGRTK